MREAVWRSETYRGKRESRSVTVRRDDGESKVTGGVDDLEVQSGQAVVQPLTG